MQPDTSHSYLLHGPGSGALLLAPQQVMSLHVGDTLSLDHQGARLSLLKGSLTIDTIAYPSLPQGVSFGRDPNFSDNLKPYCLPTEAKINSSDGWQSQLQLQSGARSGEGQVTLNVQVVASQGSFEQAKCLIIFDDGTFDSTCNPPSHTYSIPGSYELRAETTSYCGITTIQSMQIHVYQKGTSPVVSQNSVSFASTVLASIDDDPLEVFTSSSDKIRAIGIRIVDGDTFDALLGDGSGGYTQKRIRLLGVNAPELKAKDEVEKYYATQAKFFLSSLVVNKKIELEFDSKSKKIDRYGRVLAHVNVAGSSTEKQLLTAGFAKVLDLDFSQRKEFLSLQQAAQSQTRGMWADGTIALSVEDPLQNPQDDASESSSSSVASKTSKKKTAKSSSSRSVTSKKSSSSKRAASKARKVIRKTKSSAGPLGIDESLLVQQGSGSALLSVSETFPSPISLISFLLIGSAFLIGWLSGRWRSSR